MNKSTYFRQTIFLLALFLFFPSTGFAKVDLVTLPKQDKVQLTIYNSADLTLVRSGSDLTLQKGENSLQFSWANTLIDPTSLELMPKAKGDKIDVQSLVFPPRLRELGLWKIDSEESGKVPMEISYLTSGLSWRAFYMGTLSSDETIMDLKGYVRVTNNSGEDYENAQLRLIVGKVNIIDEIAILASRQHPYGRPGYSIMSAPVAIGKSKQLKRNKAKMEMMEVAGGMVMSAKEIVKEGLSEYFLYTIEGKETIANGWSKRLPSFDVKSIPVVNLFKYEEERYGSQVYRFLSFKNDEKHMLGGTPIPGGSMKVFRNVDDANHLSYDGSSSFKYIPVDEDVELNLGAVSNVIIKAILMDFKTENHSFDKSKNINGWDEVRTFTVEVKNRKKQAVKVDIKRNFNTPTWELTKSGDFGIYEKVDLDTVVFKLNLQGNRSKSFTYRLTTHHGQRAQR